MHTAKYAASKMAAAENKRMNVVRIYADKEGNSRFGSFSVSMKSIGGSSCMLAPFIEHLIGH